MSEPCIEPRSGRELELALYAGGDLAAREVAAVEAHLERCPACRATLEGLRESHAGVAALADEPLDPEALARIRGAVRRRIEEEAGREERRPAWVPALAASLLLALIAAAVWLLGGGPGDAGGGRSVAPALPPRVAAAPEAPVERPAPDRTAAPATDAPPQAPPDRPPAAPAPEAPIRQAAVERPSREAAIDPSRRESAAGSAPPAASPAATEPMVIQVVSNDPDIVFYWLVEPEEIRDETLSG